MRTEKTVQPRMRSFFLLALALPLHVLVRVGGVDVNVSAGDLLIAALLFWSVLSNRFRAPREAVLLLVFLSLSQLAFIRASAKGGYFAAMGIEPSLVSLLVDTLKLVGAMAWFIAIYALSRPNPQGSLTAFARGSVLAGSFWTFVSIASVLVGVQLRSDGPFGNANIFGGYLMVCYFMGLVLMRQDIMGRRNVTAHPRLMMATVALLLAGIVLTGSRGAAVGVLAGSGLAFVYWFKHRASTQIKPGTVFVLGIAIILATAFVMQSAGLTRLLEVSTTSGEAGEIRNLSTRLDRWAFAWKTSTQTAFMGIGGGQLGVAGLALEGFQETHNTPLSILGEQGIVGLLIFYYLVLTALRRALVLRPFTTFNVRFVLGGALLGQCVQGMVTNSQQFRVFWILLAFIFSLANDNALPGRQPVSGGNPVV